ncbi:hypothetical protein L2101_22955, partial [Citrobacter portucalensis]|nr:hypothetical protein [Citrobacter portucalensis]
MTGARRWKRKAESTAPHPYGQGAVFVGDRKQKSSVSKGLRFYGRWRTPETSAVACLNNANVTLYCHSPQSGWWFLFPVNSGDYFMSTGLRFTLEVDGLPPDALAVT